MFRLIFRKYKTQKELRFSFLLCLILLVAYMSFFYPVWKSDLDIIMITISQGTGSGVGDYHILFSNFLVGIGLKVLDKFVPLNVNWYFYMHIILSFYAIHVITYICIKRNKTSQKMGRILAGVVAAFWCYQCFMAPSYMKTSAVLCIAALFLWEYFKENQSLSVARYAIILITLALSALISLKIFLIVLGICVLAIELYHIIKNHHIIFLKKKELVMVLVFLLVVGAAWKADVMTYQRSNLWREAGENRCNIEQALGFGTAEYDAAFAKENGLKRASYAAVSQVRFYQSEKAWQQLEAITEQRIPLGLSSFLQYTRSVPIKLFSYGLFYCWILLAYFILFIKEKEKRKALMLTGLVMLLLMGLVFYYFNSLAYEIIFAIIIMICCFFFLLALHDLREDEPRYLAIYLIVFAVVLYNKFSSTFVTTVQTPDEIATTLTSVDDTKKNLVDLTAYLRLCSAQEPYPENLNQVKGLYVMDGVYGLIPGYEDLTSLSRKSIKNINIIYNPKQLTIKGLGGRG